MSSDAESWLYERLIADAGVSAVVGSKVYPHRAPQHATHPYITYRRITTRRTWDMKGPSGLADPLMQIDGWGDTEPQIRAIAEAVRASLDGASGLMTDGGEQVYLLQVVDEDEYYEDPTDASETGIFRIRIDVRVHHEESRPNRLP